MSWKHGVGVGALVGIIMLLGACGAAETQTAPVGRASGGAAGAAGSSGGGAGESSTPGAGAGGERGSGGASSELLSDSPELLACYRYLTALCQRRAECGASERSCLDNAYMCPGLLFAPGSSRTVSGLLACAAEWPTVSCEVALTGGAPSCATPGLLAVGEPCRFSVQCASSRCNAPSRHACGVCSPRLAEGDDCSANWVGCDDGLECTDGRCQPVVVPDPAPVEPSPPRPEGTLELGATCSLIARPDENPPACKAPLLCLRWVGTEGTCLFPAEFGERCDEQHDCLGITRCVDGLCRLSTSKTTPYTSCP